MSLQAIGISKQYARGGKSGLSFAAVQPTDFLLKEGELTILTGRSGSGKSTLLNILGGLLAPSTGQVLLDGQDLYSLDDKALSRLRNEHIGVIPQGKTVIDSLTVLENVKLPYLLYANDSAADARAEELLQRVGILPLKDAWPSELSGGEARRLSIARALIRKPQVILADEPTGDLDDENTAIVLQLLKDVAAEGAAVLVVTHEAEAAKYADRRYRMDGGALQELTE